MTQLKLHSGEPADVVALALFAVRWHSRHDDLGEAAAEREIDPEAARKVLWLLKDADGLDRVRIRDLDVRRLRHLEAVLRQDVAWEMLWDDDRRRDADARP